nr:hypothetical protein [Lachnospiraceae bacterium]
MKNRKKLYKIFRIFIAVVLIINFSFIDQLGKIHLKAAENNDEDIQYIEDIRAYSVEEDDDSLGEIKTKIQNDGYTMVESNLNKGTDSDKEVYLAYKTTKDRSKAIRKLGLLAMDKGYKIKDYSELKKKYLSSNSAVADTLVTVAMEFASCYEMGSPKAIEAYKGLNLIKIPEKNNQLLGEYIVEQGDDQDRDFYLNFLCTAASGLIGTVINFLYTGISAYKNEEDEDGKEVTLNWAQKAVENSLWSDIEEGLLTNGELKSLDQIYEDKARSLHEEIQKFASSYETSLNYYDENYLKEQAEKGGSVEDAVESDEELSDKENKKNMSVYYVESYNLLNKYEINGTTPLGEWFVEMGKKTSEEINIRLL